MARVVGEAARYVTRQSVKRYQREFIVINLASFFLALIIGFWLGFSLNKHTYLWILIPIFIIVLILFLSNKLIDRVTDKLERKRIDYRKGATGEALVGFLLEGLPDDYIVIHGLKPKPQYGDIDHVVVGPSGVYAIDTKNWKGVVTADGKGELLLNGKPTDKAEVRNLLRRTMFIQEKIKELSALNPFIRGVLVFPSARIEIKRGSKDYVHCKTDEELYDYIVENKKRLNRKEIDAISKAFLALVRKDKDFASDSK